MVLLEVDNPYSDMYVARWDVLCPSRKEPMESIWKEQITLGRRLEDLHFYCAQTRTNQLCYCATLAPHVKMETCCSTRKALSGIFFCFSFTVKMPSRSVTTAASALISLTGTTLLSPSGTVDCAGGAVET